MLRSGLFCFLGNFFRDGDDLFLRLSARSVRPHGVRNGDIVSAVRIDLALRIWHIFLLVPHKERRQIHLTIIYAEPLPAFPYSELIK